MKVRRSFQTPKVNWNRMPVSSIAAALGSQVTVIPLPPTRNNVFGADVAQRSITVGALEGWRFWRIDFENQLLRSAVYRECVWYPGDMAASAAPTDKNTDGFYAFRDINNLIKYIWKINEVVCIGLVEMWGEVIEGETGYRAEFARISRLLTFATTKKYSSDYYSVNKNPMDALTYQSEHYLLEELRLKYHPKEES